MKFILKWIKAKWNHDKFGLVLSQLQRQQRDWLVLESSRRREIIHMRRIINAARYQSQQNAVLSTTREAVKIEGYDKETGLIVLQWLLYRSR